MSLNNAAVSSSSEDSFQPQDKLTMTSLHHSSVLYSLSNQTAIKKEPLDGGIYSSYHTGLHLDPSGQISYTSPDSASSHAADATVSSSSSEPEVYTTLTNSTPLMAQTDQDTHHHLQPAEYLGSHEVHRGAPPSHLMGPGMNSDYMNLPESKADGSGPGGMNEMVRAMCGELEEGKELAKLQTVQMDEDMSDL